MNVSSALIHMSSKAWAAALKGSGWGELVAASNLEKEGVVKGALLKATRKWAYENGLGRYEPTEGYVTVQLSREKPSARSNGRARSK